MKIFEQWINSVWFYEDKLNFAANAGLAIANSHSQAQNLGMELIWGWYKEYLTATPIAVSH